MPIVNMATTERHVFKNVWNQYSDIVDARSMMLNDQAHTLEEGDRNDILSSLPHFTNMQIVDIGAGIGRYTGPFSTEAKDVLAVDFIDPFLDKNRELHGHLSNVQFEHNDAVHLKLPSESRDFVFTNWLLMYLTDPEVVHFLQNSVLWLRPGGFLHIRESCSQPSSRNKKGNFKKHESENPTFYRQSSQYLELLRQFVCKDSNGKYWKLKPLWAKSVPTYIELERNWRQVHLLAQKVPARSCEMLDDNELYSLISTFCPNKQQQIDQLRNEIHALFFNKRLMPLESLLIQKIKVLPENSQIAILNGGKTDFCDIRPSVFAEHFNSKVTVYDRDIFSFRSILSKAHEAEDIRVRVNWISDFNNDSTYFHQKDSYDLIIGFDLFGSEIEDFEMIVQNLKTLLGSGGRLVTIETELSPENGLCIVEKTLQTTGFSKTRIQINDVKSDIASQLTSLHKLVTTESTCLTQMLEITEKIDKWYMIEITS